MLSGSKLSRGYSKYEILVLFLGLTKSVNKKNLCSKCDNGVCLMTEYQIQTWTRSNEIFAGYAYMHSCAVVPRKLAKPQGTNGVIKTMILRWYVSCCIVVTQFALFQSFPLSFKTLSKLVVTTMSGSASLNCSIYPHYRRKTVTAQQSVYMNQSMIC